MCTVAHNLVAAGTANCGYTMFDMDTMDAYYFENAHIYTSHMLTAIPTRKEIAAIQARLAAAQLQPSCSLRQRVRLRSLLLRQ